MTVTDKIALPHLIFHTRDLFLKKKKKKKRKYIVQECARMCDWRAVHARLCVKSCQTEEGQQSFCSQRGCNIDAKVSQEIFIK